MNKPAQLPASSVFTWSGACRVAEERIPYQRFVVQRTHKGAMNENARLTPEKVMAICKRYDQLGPACELNIGRRYGGVQQIADDFGVTRQCVRKIATGHLWASVTGRTPQQRRPAAVAKVDWATLKRLAKRSGA